jgi:hypothetical protein
MRDGVMRHECQHVLSAGCVHTEILIIFEHPGSVSDSDPDYRGMLAMISTLSQRINDLHRPLPCVRRPPLLGHL